MVDIALTAGRIYGMVVDPQTTLAHNSQPVPPWQIVAKEHVLPLIITTAVLHTVLSWLLFPLYEMIASNQGAQLPELANPALMLMMRTITQLIGLIVWGIVLGFFAGILGGRNDFNAAYLLAALALTPYIVAGALNPIPLIGTLLWLCSLVYALVIIYRGVPVLLGVPEENRAKHFTLSLVVMVVVALMVTRILLSVTGS